MFNANRPALSELPTTKELLKSTGIAIAAAGALLVTVVLPAEYGIDPTRIGSVLGLTEMGRIKRDLAQEASVDVARDGVGAPVQAAAAPVPVALTPPAATEGGRSDVTTLTLAPDQGAEIKLVMKAGAAVRYSWSSNGGKVNFDIHGDRSGTAYHGYGKGSAPRQEATLVAAFDGNHGWFWRNRTGAPVTIVLKTQGAYAAIKRVV